MIEVSGQNLDIDVKEELEVFLDNFKKMRIRDNKIQCCSPFRDEKTPSFAVNLDNGSWIDSGAYEEKFRKGHFIELLAFLMEVELKEVEEYLIGKYGIQFKNVDELKLTFDLGGVVENKKVFTVEELQPFMFRHPYLTNRGISEKTQRAFKIGYDQTNEAIMIPWMDKNGDVVNVKFRSVNTKRFFYAKDGQRIKHHLFGLNFIYRLNCKEAVIVESETDCMYLWSWGIPAIACGSASLSEKQFELLKASPLESIVIGADNDNAGHRFRAFLKQKLVGRFEVLDLALPNCKKDVNDLTPEQLKHCYNNRKPVGLALGMQLKTHKRHW